MNPPDPPFRTALEAILSTGRPIRAQHMIQTACKELPPDQLTRLYLGFRDAGRADLVAMAPNYRDLTTRSMIRAARNPRFVADPPLGALRLFRSAGEDISRKALHILISARDGHFFLPLSLMLHNLPPGPADALVVACPGRGTARSAMAPLGLTMAEVAQGLNRHFRVQDYGRITVTGSSINGPYALSLGQELGAAVAVSLAGRKRDDVLRLRSLSEEGFGNFDEACICNPRHTPRMINVIGSMKENDVQAARVLRAWFPDMLVYHLLLCRGHNPMAQMRGTRTLGAFHRVVYGGGDAILPFVVPVFAAVGGALRAVRRLLRMQ